MEYGADMPRNSHISDVPGGGLQVSGDASGGLSIPGKPFADALFASWLQMHPIFSR